MYGLKLQRNGFLRSEVIQRALSDLDASGELHLRRMRELSAIESLEARGMQYSNQDFDVLSSALNFLDAVAPDVAGELRVYSRTVANGGTTLPFNEWFSAWRTIHANHAERIAASA